MCVVHPVANDVLKRITCQPNVAMSILKHIKPTVRFRFILSIPLSYKPGAIADVIDGIREEASVQFLHNKLKYDADILEAAVGNKYFILGWLFRGDLRRLLYFIIKWSRTSAPPSSQYNKDLPVNWQFCRIKENVSVASIMILSNQRSVDTLVSDDLQPSYFKIIFWLFGAQLCF